MTVWASSTWAEGVWANNVWQGLSSESVAGGNEGAEGDDGAQNIVRQPVIPRRITLGY